MDDDGKSKLFRLVRLGKTKEVKEALATGALDVNEKDAKGDSLLHLAARNGHKSIVKELLRRNCEYEQKNAAGKEAWELAFEFNYSELGDYIRDKTGLPPLGSGGGVHAANGTAEGGLDHASLEDQDHHHAAAGGGGKKEPGGKNSDDDGLDLLDLPGLDEPKLGGKSASRDKQDPHESKPQRMPAVDLKKSQFDPMGSVGLGGSGDPGKRASWDPLGSAGLPKDKQAEATSSGGARGSPEKREFVAGQASRAEFGADFANANDEKRDRDVGGVRARAGGTGGLGVGGGGTWREKVDFDLVARALVSARGGANLPSGGQLKLDAEFWARVEGLMDAAGLPKLEARTRQLEGVVEGLWGRFALFKNEDVEGVRLQSELRGLHAKMGEGKDVDGVLEERDRLRHKHDKADQMAGELASKIQLLEMEVADASARLEEARRENEELLAKLRGERRGREASDDKCKELEHMREDLEREAREAKEAAAAERRALNGVRGDLNKVKDIKVAWLSAADLDELFRRHDRDNSGDISAEEMKPFVEELLGMMQRRMEMVSADAKRESSRAEAAEADRERDKQRAKEMEARLTKQIERLDQDLEISDNAARMQAQQFQDRLDKQKQRLETALEAAKAFGEAEVLRVQQEADSHLATREAIHTAKFVDLEKASSAEIERLKAHEAELSAALAETDARADALAGKLKVSEKSLAEAKAKIARIEKEAAASQSHTVLSEVFALHSRLGVARQQLLGLRTHAEQVSEDATTMLRQAGEELEHFCTFVLPLPHEAADKLRTDKLTPAQLAQGLKHMMGKYRGAAEQNRKQNLELQSLKGAMRVYCRVRPLRPGPEAEDGTCLHLRGLGALSLLEKNGTKEFQFDYVYGPNSKQEGIFDDARPLLQTIMDGFNVSVMAYGPTGSGKTYSITGAGIGGGAQSKHRGLVQRMLEDVFKTIKERAVLVDLHLKISMFEIYNEDVRDLLTGGGGAHAKGTVAERDSLKVSTDRHGSVVIEGLQEYAVDSLAKGLALVEHGQGVRATCATNINEHSSRSHLLIRFSVQSVDKRTGERHSGKMYLIDLAGCENVSQSGAQGRALREAIGINKSLAALHDVMLALSNKESHVPYRNSTLTKVLADSLGGQAKCLMYVMVSPATKDRLVTLSALKFAARCKAIVLGEAKSNVDKSVFTELEEAREKLQAAEAQLEESNSARAEYEQRLQLSSEIIVECSRFEDKLRDLFGLGAAGKKNKSKGPDPGDTASVVQHLVPKAGGGKKGAGGGKKVKAMYLDEASRHLINKRQVHDDLLKSLSRGVDAFGDALRQKDAAMDEIQRKNDELMERLAAANKTKALQQEKKDKRERERQRDVSRDREGSEFHDNSSYSERDKDMLSPSPNRRAKGLVAWDHDERDRGQEAQGWGGRDRDRDVYGQARLPVARKPDWDRRTRANGKGVPADMKWEQRMAPDAGWVGGGGARSDGEGLRRHPHEPLYPRGAGVAGNRAPPPQWGPQGKASRHVSARLEERRAQLREREREALQDQVRAVSSPQV